MSITNVLDIGYVKVGCKELDATQAFIEDFGMQIQRVSNQRGDNIMYSRGTDGAPYHHVAVEGSEGFLGVAFEAESREALEQLAKQANASDIEPIDAPGGGEKVTFTDPNGYTVEIIYGWQRGNKTAPIGRPAFNNSEVQPRISEPVRLKQDRSQVKRLGHCVLFVKNFRESEAWYKEHFGFITTDEIYAGVEENVIGAFMRCDRGETPVDHHTLAIMQAPDPAMTGMQHAAFEVHDWDDLMIGHHFLANSGHKPQWGVGKHILGSQVFDYWYDPDGQVMEHFTDSDLFDASVPTNLAPIEALLGAQWGPAMDHGGPPPVAEEA